MEKFFASTGRHLEVAKGFVHGLGQAVTVTGGAARKEFPRPRPPEEALAGDWAKLGDDMRNAAHRVLEGGAKR